MRQRGHFGQMHSKLIKYEYAGSRLGVGRPIFGRAEIKPSRLIFSQLGMAAGETLEIFTHAAYEADGTTPIEYNGDFYLISAETESDTRVYVTLKAARCEKVTCEVTETETALDALRRPVKKEKGSIKYDGFWTERYDGNAAETEGHGITAQRMVLLLPKETDFACGTVIRVLGDPFIVTKRYMSGRYRNEYELLKEADR